MSQGPYDVFISYRHADKQWTRKTLLPRLEAAGLRACIDFRDFKLGGAVLDEMERAVVESRFTIAVMTRDYLDGGFTHLEEIMADHLGTTERNERLIVLLRDGTMPSLRLKARLMLDMSDDGEFETAATRLVEALNG